MCCIDGSTKALNSQENYVEAVNISPAQARLKLTVLNKQAEAKNSWEFFSEMKSLGLPSEVIEILKKVLEVTSKVANKTIAIGKIIVSKLLRYTAEHPLQVAGLAVGLYATYTLGVALHGIFVVAPWIAKVPVLGKLALLISGLCKVVIMPIIIAAPAAGVVAGEILDQKFPQVSESCQKIAKEYFELFSQIINAVKDELESNEFSPAFS